MIKKGILPSRIGVIHLPPLPGSASALEMGASQALHQAGLQALKEAKILQAHGFDAILIENFGDAPFFKESVLTETALSLTLIATAIKESVKIPVGLNVLRNDALTALTVATLTGLSFIRVNVLSGVVATDQGLIEGRAAEVIRKKKELQSSVKVLADVFVKHGETLHVRSLKQAIKDTLHRAGADAVILTGGATGESVDKRDLEEARKITAAEGVPLFVGSGVNGENYPEIRKFCDGILVSSALRKGGRAGAPLDLARVRKLTAVFHSSKRSAAPRKLSHEGKTKKKEAEQSL